ncbi:conserved oligomeric Golgi complex subunit 6 [Zooshikella harenae]|uniref:Septation ring formation regulator EzrA n=1 Tax=Zooshikella harenae TaxID=2827238 RepID=A0ABS5ZF91_9GAMM|nr:conserved oligomeric Golgi complex subunit 6 [Zooshikella harenae]MBU2712655.1 hypothetical protein [Zooshikella harenae]
MDLDYTKIVLLEVMGVAVGMTFFVLYRYYKLSTRLKRLNSGEGNDKQLLAHLKQHLAKLDHYADLPEVKDVTSFLTEEITKGHIYSIRRRIISIELEALEHAEDYPEYEKLAGDGYGKLMQEFQDELHRILSTYQKSYADIVDDQLKEIENQEYRFGSIPINSIAIGHLTDQSAFNLFKAILKVERESLRKSDDANMQLNALIEGLKRLFGYITERYVNHTDESEGTLIKEYSKLIVGQHKREIQFYQKRVDYLERLKDMYKSYINQVKVGFDHEKTHEIMVNMSDLVDEAQAQVKSLEEEIYKDNNLITILKNKNLALENSTISNMRDSVKDDVLIRRVIEKGKQDTKQLLSLVKQLEFDKKQLTIELNQKEVQIRLLSDKTEEEKIKQSYTSVLNRLKKISHDYRHLEKQYLDLKNQQSRVG